MIEYVQIINQGQFCEVMGRNNFGGIVLRNPNYGRSTLIFNEKAVKPAPHGQYVHCRWCHSPILIIHAPPKFNEICNDLCAYESREHYS